MCMDVHVDMCLDMCIDVVYMCIYTCTITYRYHNSCVHGHKTQEFAVQDHKIRESNAFFLLADAFPHACTGCFMHLFVWLRTRRRGRGGGGGLISSLLGRLGWADAVTLWLYVFYGRALSSAGFCLRILNNALRIYPI